MRRPARAAYSFVTATLAIALVAVLGWAVLGKHRLDQQARLVYKATRFVVSEVRPAAPAPLDLLVAADVSPLRDLSTQLESPQAVILRPQAVRGRSSCRSPPRAQ